MLRVDARDLKPVQWTSPSDLEVGSWLIGPGVDRTVASLGVVSVGPREIVSTAVLGVMIDEIRSTQLESFALAVALVLALIAAFFRSARAAALALVPTALVPQRVTVGGESFVVEVPEATTAAELEVPGVALPEAR